MDGKRKKRCESLRDLLQELWSSVHLGFAAYREGRSTDEWRSAFFETHGRFLAVNWTPHLHDPRPMIEAVGELRESMESLVVWQDCPIEQRHSLHVPTNAIEVVRRAQAALREQGDIAEQSPDDASDGGGSRIPSMPTIGSDTEIKLKLSTMGFSSESFDAVLGVIQNPSLNTDQKLSELKRIDNVVSSRKFTSGELGAILGVSGVAVRQSPTWQDLKPPKARGGTTLRRR